jgi:hypothetical protein
LKLFEGVRAGRVDHHLRPAADFPSKDRRTLWLQRTETAHPIRIQPEDPPGDAPFITRGKI